MTSPFVTLKPTRRIDANHGGDFFKLFLRANRKCARPQIADRRIGIDRSIYMICMFIFIAVISRFAAMAFFDRRPLGGLDKMKKNMAIPPCTAVFSRIIEIM